jgi:DMSO reductase family type II enzyme chaperone
MTAAAAARGAVEQALCRSALYEAVALGFRPPVRETVRRLASPAARGLAVAARFAAGLEAAVLAEAVAAAAPSPGVLADAHRRLFGVTARGPVPLCETEYGDENPFLQPQELADIGGFYAAFGLAMVAGSTERVDHVSCEAEFLLFLARREAAALEQGDGAAREATVRAARLFLRDHFGRWVPALAARLERAEAGGFYAALARLAAAFVRAECRRLGVRVGPSALNLRPPAEDRVPMACGDCPLDVPDGDAHTD